MKNRAYQDKEVLRKLYMEEGKTTIEISVGFGVNSSTIYLWIKKFGFPIHYGNPRILILQEDFLRKEYGENRKSLPQIAKEVGCSDDVVRYRLMKYGIPVRKISEALTGTKKPEYMREIFRVRAKKMFTGENNPNWKGGVTSKHHTFRTSIEYLIYQKAIWERDNYTCAKCGSWKKPQVHHILPLWYNWEVRLDMNNGITLCKDCHQKIRGNELRYALAFSLILLKKRVNSGKPLSTGNPEPSRVEPRKVQRLLEEDTSSLMTSKNALHESEEIVQF